MTFKMFRCNNMLEGRHGVSLQGLKVWSTHHFARLSLMTRHQSCFRSETQLEARPQAQVLGVAVTEAGSLVSNWPALWIQLCLACIGLGPSITKRYVSRGTGSFLSRTKAYYCAHTHERWKTDFAILRRVGGVVVDRLSLEHDPHW